MDIDDRFTEKTRRAFAAMTLQQNEHLPDEYLKRMLLLGLPYLADESRDNEHRHWHIRNSSGFPLLDLNTPPLPPSAAAMVREFVLEACNSYHRREDLLREALADLDVNDCSYEQIKAELKGGV